MKISYTPSALRQLVSILDYIAQRNPQGARRVQTSIQSTIDLLALYPAAGRVTDEPGQRRIVASPYPYAVFYRTTPDAVVIFRIRHTSRRVV